MTGPQIELDFQELKKATAENKQEIASLKRKVDDLQGAVLALQNIVYRRQETPKEVKRRPGPQSTSKADVLVGLAPELCEKLEVYEKEGLLCVKTKEYLRPKTAWNTVNKYLRSQGFMWNSQGADSFWSRPK